MARGPPALFLTGKRSSSRLIAAVVTGSQSTTSLDPNAAGILPGDNRADDEAGYAFILCLGLESAYSFGDLSDAVDECI